MQLVLVGPLDAGLADLECAGVIGAIDFLEIAGADVEVEREILRSLSGLARFEKPKRVALLPRELSLDSGEMTATLKLKRRAIETIHNDLIERLYRPR